MCVITAVWQASRKRGNTRQADENTKVKGVLFSQARLTATHINDSSGETNSDAD